VLEKFLTGHSSTKVRAGLVTIAWPFLFGCIAASQLCHTAYCYTLLMWGRVILGTVIVTLTILWLVAIWVLLLDPRTFLQKCRTACGTAKLTANL
jgi:hypothetical protein